MRYMRLPLALTVALVAALSIASVASAQPSKQQRTIHRLRVELAVAWRAEHRTKASLALTQQQAVATEGSLNAQIAQANVALTSTRAQLSGSQAQASSLRAQLAAIPSPLAVAVEQVRREVAYSESVLRANATPYSHGQLISQAAMDYVVGHVNAPTYGYDVAAGESMVSTPDAILGAQAGICGSAALTFAAIVKRFGFSVRSVQFYYGPNGAWNHIADEVSYDGGWHYFDPTFGLDYAQDGSVLSITDARAAADPSSLVQQDGTLFWTQVVTQAGITELNDMAFATDPATTVVLDGQQFVG